MLSTHFTFLAPSVKARILPYSLWLYVRSWLNNTQHWFTENKFNTCSYRMEMGVSVYCAFSCKRLYSFWSCLRMSTLVCQLLYTSTIYYVLKYLNSVFCLSFSEIIIRHHFSKVSPGWGIICFQNHVFHYRNDVSPYFVYLYHLI